MKFLIMFSFISCAAYTDPNQAKLTYYKCDQNRIITTKDSDDYQTIAIRYSDNQQISLHHFVSLLGTGYRNERFLWLTKDNSSVLVEKQSDGSEKFLYNNCKPQK